VVRRAGTAAELHGRPFDAGAGRRVEVLETTSPALVLGSTQSDGVVDLDAARATGTDVVRRRSGGGAVLLRPGRDTWVDVTIGRGDPLWDDDVAVAFHWLGHAWARAARTLGVAPAVHTGPPLETAWSRRVCFAGVGAGEVVLGGRKLVGISQRRTRDGARFQCLLLRAWDPRALLDLLALDALERAEGVTALEGLATGLDVPTEDVVDALVASLPA
jgi:lipoate-protein ligase A